MRKYFVLLLVVVLSELCFAQTIERNSSAVNKLQPRTQFISSMDIGEAFVNRLDSNSNIINLSGEWKFLSVDEISVSEAVKEGHDFSEWQNIFTPGSWAEQGYAQSEVGIYKSYVDIPGLWLDRDIFFSLDAAKSEAHLYVNGKRVGANSDSKTRAEYDITKFVHTGANEIAIVLYKFSSANIMEAADSSDNTGIYYDTYIMAQPKCRIDDFELTAVMDKNYKDGRLDVRFSVANTYNSAQTITIGYDIIDDSSRLVTYNNREITIPANSTDTISMGNFVINPKVWSAQMPNLYKLLFRVKKDNLSTEFFTFNFGFRNIKIENNNLYINDNREKIKGVNYTTYNPQTGKYRTAKSVERDLSLMKQYSINSIRTEHNAQPSFFYELCNKYGFYVFDMANISSNGELGNSPEMLESYIQRTKNLYFSNRNYSSIVAWQLGDNAGNGYNLYKTYNLLQELDTIRPVLYAGAGLEWNSDIYMAKDVNLSEIEGWIEKQKDRPYIIGSLNNINDLDSLLTILDSDSTVLQGGFICDWTDMVQYKDSLTTDSSKIAIVEPRAILGRLGKIYQNIRFEDVDINRGKLKVVNNNFSDSLNLYKIVYHIYKEGVAKPIARGNIPTPINPQSAREFQIPLRVYVPVADKYNYYVELMLKTTSDMYGIKKGTTIASGQIKVPKQSLKPVEEVEVTAVADEEKKADVVNEKELKDIINNE